MKIDDIMENTEVDITGNSAESDIAEETKKCPFCGEEILAVAKKCRYCGEWLENNVRHEKEIEETPEEEAPASPNLLVSFGLYLVKLWWLLALLIIAALCVPGEDSHKESVRNGVVKCVEAHSNGILGRLGYTFFGGLSSLSNGANLERDGILEVFDQNNEIVVEKYPFWSTGKVINQLHPSGTDVSLGMFGFVIPFVSWKDISMMDKTSSESSDYNYGHDINYNIEDISEAEENVEEMSNALIMKYEGNIEGIKCHFQLSFEEDDTGEQHVSGTYYYEKQGPHKKIILRGLYNESTGVLFLQEYLEDGTPNASMLVECGESGGDFSGTFTKVDGEQMFIYMTRTY